MPMTPEFEKVARKAVQEWKARGDDAPSAAHDLEVLCGKNNQEYRPDGERIIEEIYDGKLVSAPGGAGLTFQGKHPEGEGGKRLDARGEVPGRVAVPNAESNPPGTPTEASKRGLTAEPLTAAERARTERAEDAGHVRGVDPNAMPTGNPIRTNQPDEDEDVVVDRKRNLTPSKKR